MSLAMPAPFETVLARRAEIVAALEGIVRKGAVIAEEVGLRAYGSDGLTAYHQTPFVVVLPETSLMRRTTCA